MRIFIDVQDGGGSSLLTGKSWTRNQRRIFLCFGRGRVVGGFTHSSSCKEAISTNSKEQRQELFTNQQALIDKDVQIGHAFGYLMNYGDTKLHLVFSLVGGIIQRKKNNVL